MAKILRLSFYIEKVSDNADNPALRFLSSKLPPSPISSAEEEVPEGKADSQFTASNDQRFYANLPESIWFATGSFLQQGTEVIPRTSAGRNKSALHK